MGPKPSVLVVDDDGTILELLCRALGDSYEVHAVSSGAEALARARGHRFAACILDVDLPDANGITLKTELAELAPEVASRILLMSGRIGAGSSDKHENGEFIPKPFKVADLVQRVDRMTQKQGASDPR